MIKKDLTGKVFGALTVLRYVGIYHFKNGSSTSLWECRCKYCNKTSVKMRSAITRGMQSCGCRWKENISKSESIHGGRKTKLYGVWVTMKNRCKNPHVRSYKDYGGRGIGVCKEWNDFARFQQWAFANGYKEGLQIDRIDYNGDYCPDNCRWVDKYQQANNKRNNHFVVYRGERLTLNQIEHKYGVDHRLVGARLKRGWNIENAIEVIPIRGRNQTDSYAGT